MMTFNFITEVKERRAYLRFDWPGKGK